MEQEEKRKTKAQKAALPEETPKAGLFELFLTFVRIGAATFGGGVAMLPVIEHEVTEKKHWASEDELTDYYAISQCTPGAIAVNTATFVGSKMRGAIGGIVATLGVIFPSMVIICERIRLSSSTHACACASFRRRSASMAVKAESSSTVPYASTRRSVLKTRSPPIREVMPPSPCLV